MKSLLVKSGVILIIGLALFSYAEVCGAEGAWVLWEKWHYPNPIKGEALEYINTDWQLSNAYPNYEMCIKKRDATINALKKRWDASQVISLEDGFWVKGESLPSGGFSIKFSYEGNCFPDTIDPRK